MSHEAGGFDRRTVYRMPGLPSDVARFMQFSEFFDSYRGATFVIQTKDGWSWSSSIFRDPEFTVTFKARTVLDDLIGDATENALGRMFLDGDIEIEGDSFTLLAVAKYALSHSAGLSHSMIHTLTHASREVFNWLRPHRSASAPPRWRSATCISDLPIDFFQHWLGSLLGQSCACFRNSGEDFETAQRNRLESVCTSLDLQKEDRLLDVGCGWGSFLFHAAETRKSTLLGITTSPQQATATSELIGKNGLERWCAVEHRDIGTVPYPPETFDKIADINVLEQAAISQIPRYFDCMHDLLTPGGLLLLHSTTRSAEVQSQRTGSHRQDVLFTAGSVPLSAELQAAESAGFEILRVESLREEYRHTLRVWITRLQQNTQLGITYGQHRGYRAWLLYLVDAAANFESGGMQFHQILLRRPLRSRNERSPGQIGGKGQTGSGCRTSRLWHLAAMD